jgi:hypothetical protein
MITILIKRLFGKLFDPIMDDKTERVVNIVWTKEEWWREGYDTNSIFRVIDYEHEKFLLRDSEFVIEAVAVIATPLTCPLNNFTHRHGCYSVSYDDEITEISE